MTDKQIIETLRNIKTYCNSFGMHSKCKFYNPSTSDRCVICELMTELQKTEPSYWDMDAIERIIKDA